jgi:hypothetical protein
VIISASYKTDIPAFYGDWFIRRLRAGYCLVLNPFNNRTFRVSLARTDVDGIVFWTKNVAPFLGKLDEVSDRGYPFILQHTINGYPRAYETAVVDASKSVAALHMVAEKFGPRVPVWRYDTIVLSNLTPADFHVEKFARLAEHLAGATDEVVVSFVQTYKKTMRNLEVAGLQSGFDWYLPTLLEKKALLRQLADIAASHKLMLRVCSQPDLAQGVAPGARCVDADRLSSLIGQRLTAKLKGSRKECGCFESKDIGAYDTCPHGCVYCYAVQNRKLALSRYKSHDANSELLMGNPRDHLRELAELPLFKG